MSEVESHIVKMIAADNSATLSEYVSLIHPTNGQTMIKMRRNINACIESTVARIWEWIKALT